MSAVNLTWDAPTNERINGHVVEFRLSGSDTWNEGPTVTSTNSVSVPGMNGVQYQYRVAATDENGGRSEWGSYCVLGWGNFSPNPSEPTVVPTQFTGGALVGTTIAQVDGDCAVTRDGRVICGIASSSSALVVDGDLSTKRVVQIDGDCAVTTESQAMCGIQPGGTLPTLVTSGALAGKSVIQVADSINHTCAVTSEGQVACWGSNMSGQLGTGTNVDRATPTLVFGALTGKTVAAVSVGPFATCAIMTDGTLSCWGGNELLAIGELGNQTSNLPVVSNAGALSNKTITKVDLGESTACAVTSDGEAVCWGDELDQPLPLGGGARENVTGRTPLFPSNEALHDQTVIDIEVGLNQVCALTSVGAVVCWGSANDGFALFGDGTTVGGTGEVNQSTIRRRSGTALVRASMISVQTLRTFVIWDGQAVAGQAPSMVTALSANSGVGKTIQVDWDPPAYRGPGDSLEYRIDYSTDGGRQWVQSSTWTRTTSSTLSVPQDGYYLIGVVARNNSSDSTRTIATRETLVDTENSILNRTNVKFTVVTPDGRPLVGATARWENVSGTQGSTGSVTTDATGSGRFPLVATGPVKFVLNNGRVGTSQIRVSAIITDVVLESGASVTLTTPPVPTVASRTVRAVMPDDTPVPETRLIVGGGLWDNITTGFKTSLRDFTASWLYDGRPSGFPNRLQTGSDGQIKISGFEVPTIGADVTGSFTDGFIDQRVSTNLMQPSNVLRFEQMPAVKITVDTETQFNIGQAVNVEVIAVDGAGEPIENAAITLQRISGTSTTSAGQIRSKVTCGQKLTGTTTSTGSVQLRVCASATATWRADGANLVPSRPVTIKVRSKPTAPTITSIKSGNRSLTVTFTAPKSNGGVAITNYQYSTDNGKTWRACSPAAKTSPFTITIRSESSQRLANGTTYSVKIRAVNAVGFGTASGTKTGRPK